MMVFLARAGVSLALMTAVLTTAAVTAPGSALFRNRLVTRVTTLLLFPLLLFASPLPGISRSGGQHAFVAFNKAWVLERYRKVGPLETILLLMSHCLQHSDCPVRITHQVDNCRRCGRCVVTDLIQLAISYEVELGVVTCGALARRVVSEFRPELIMAVACERDLVSGIRDATPYAVYGIIDSRPHGPCFHTRVSLARMDEVLQVMRPGQGTLHG